MKNHINRVLALVVALLVLCAPLGAMAEEGINATLALSNLSLSIGEDINVNVDVTARLDLTADMENGVFAGTVTALSGSEKALKGGFNFDLATMDLTASLEGMPHAALVPMAEAVATLQEQLSSILPEETMAQIMNVINAYTNLIEAAQNMDPEVAAALSENMTTWVEQQFADSYKGETSIEVDGNSLTAQQYDFEVTMNDMLTLSAANFDILKNDSEFMAALQAYVDALMALTGEESIDIAGLDMNALTGEIGDVSFAGSLYLIGSDSMLLDMTMTAAEDDETVVIPMQFTVLSDEGAAYVGFAMDADVEGQRVSMSIDANVPTDGTPAFDLAISAVTGTSDDDAQNVTVIFSVDGTEGADVTLYLESTSTYTYDDNTYNSLTALGLNYAGTMTSDENGIACPGTLSFYVNNDGMEITAGFDTLVSLNAASTVEFSMPADTVNVLEADEETMNALFGEFMEALSGGLSALMGAPGAQDLMGLLG